MLQWYIYLTLKGYVFIVSSNSPFTKAEKYKKENKNHLFIILYPEIILTSWYVPFVLFFTICVNIYKIGIYSLVLCFFTSYFTLGIFLTSLNLLLNKFSLCCILSFLSCLLMSFVYLLCAFILICKNSLYSEAINFLSLIFVWYFSWLFICLLILYMEPLIYKSLKFFL